VGLLNFFLYFLLTSILTIPYARIEFTEKANGRAE
jgi:hypothetical protein